MGLNISLIAVFLLLVFSAMKGISLLYPLSAGLLLFIYLALKAGHTPKAIQGMVWHGIRKPAKIYEITMLVGASASLWMACGAVPFFIFHGLRMITPEYFVVSVFLITCILSLAIGSAFGTTGIIGVVFMVMARTGGVDPNLAAGAIVTAAYFSERTTPLSSCANLVAVLTGTDLYGYLKRLFAGTLPVLLFSTVVYGLLSLQHPLKGSFGDVASGIEGLFSLTPWAALPALVVILCVALKADVRWTLLLSILTAGITGVMIQDQQPLAMLDIMLRGFRLDPAHPLAASLQSGGMAAMVRPVLVIAMASAYSGIFEGTGMLSHFERHVAAIAGKLGRFAAVLVTSIVSACFGCSQTFSVITTYQFMAPYYEDSAEGRMQTAYDIGNTAVVIPALIPWNVAFTIPAAILSVDVGFIPYAFFLYLVPLSQWGLSCRKRQVIDQDI